MNKYFAYFFGLIFLIISCKPENRNTAASEADDPDTFDSELWKSVTPGLNGGFGSTDIRYSRSTPPQSGISDSVFLTAWRGENVNIQMVFWSRSDEGETDIDLSNLVAENDTILSSNLTAGALGYVLTDEFLDGCGFRDKDSLPVHLFADMIDSTSKFTLPGFQSRPVWICLNVPEEAQPGIYIGKVTSYSERDTLVAYIELNVQDIILPSPSKWSFHLDLWQNPYAVARYHNVTEWSQEHMDLMEPILRLLARAGQKCITTTLNEKPWGGQTYDPFGSMINWIKNSDGSWDYDYSTFDQYVNLAIACGITDQINCYSMVPWGNRLSWYDENISGFVTEEIIPGSERYNEIWKPFLLDFKMHLIEAGWLDITFLALDERGKDEMVSMFNFLDRVAPEFKIAMAGNYFEGITNKIDDFSYGYGGISDRSEDIAKARKESGQLTTYYVCCSDSEPNNFTFSPPAESCFEGWLAAAMGFDGFLRWAFNSWVENPVYDSRFRTWPSGDTYFIYPGARSSIRFERLIEGIQDFEKLRIIRENLATNPSIEASDAEKRIDLFFDSIDSKSLKTRSAEEIISEGKIMINSITLLITE